MYRVKGRLTPEVGALLMRAIEAAGDALYRRDGSRELESEDDTLKAAVRRRADAVGLLAERAMAAGFGAGPDEAPASGTRAERYQVVLHVDEETLKKDGEEDGGEDGAGTRSHLEDGTRVYLASLEELADAHPECATRITRAAARFS